MQSYQAANDALKDKVILVTGAGDGIGKEAALTYASHGATVILLGKTVSKLTAVYDEIIAAGGKEPAIIPLDLKVLPRNITAIWHQQYRQNSVNLMAYCIMRAYLVF